MDEIETLKTRLIYLERYYLTQKEIMTARIKKLEIKHWDDRIEKHILETDVLNITFKPKK